MKTSSSKTENRRGLTLVEILVTLGVLSSLVAVAVFAVTNLSGRSERQKLVSDVATLNSALRVYQANGGSLAGVTNPAGALTRLKTVSANWKEIAGLRDSMVDPRLDVVWVTRGRSVRALWDADKGRFVLGDSGRGVEKFVLNEALSEVAAVEEERTAHLKLATRDTWVWDYQDRGGDSNPDLVRPGAGGVPTPGGPGGGPGSTQLLPPEISLPGGDYPLKEFDLSVFLRNPNSSTISILMIQIDSGSWQEYKGGEITVEIGTTVKAYAVSTDPDWRDSRRIRHRYNVIPVDLELVLDFEKPAYNYIELGGALMPGAYPAPELAAPGRAEITNISELPVSLQNSDVFKIHWTYDGQAPGGATGEDVSPDFSGGFPGVDLPLEMAKFTGQPNLDIRAAIKVAPAYSYISEATVDASLSIEPLQLRPPLLGGIAGAYMAAQTVDLGFDVDGGDVPEGARIFYTLDGTDPGFDADGEPLGGALYTGAFSISVSRTVKARVYAPTGYEDWFLPSDLFEGQLIIPGSEDLYVGGDFTQAGNRNGIARLTPTGTVDTAFNPGEGVTPGSFVSSVIHHRGGSGILAGGSFGTMSSTQRLGLARLGYDGALDLSFDAQLE